MLFIANVFTRTLQDYSFRCGKCSDANRISLEWMLISPAEELSLKEAMFYGAKYSSSRWGLHPRSPRFVWKRHKKSGTSRSSLQFQWHKPKALQWRHNGHDSVSNHQPHDCLLNRLFWRRPKKTSKLRVTGLCVGNSPGTGEFPAQMVSNAENVSIGWRHHGIRNWVNESTQPIKNALQDQYNSIIKDQLCVVWMFSLLLIWRSW